MGWQVALILDYETDPGTLLGQMPVWAVSTAAREESAIKLRKDWESLWEPEHALTLINSLIADGSVEALSGLIPTIEEHHPSMACVLVFGPQEPKPLRQVMSSLGYLPTSENANSSIGFARPISDLPDVAELVLDAAGWQSADDVFDGFFRAVGAPSWHGRNFNALNDSIATGNINKIDVPYRIIIRNAASIGNGAVTLINSFEDLVGEIQSRGCPVEMRIEQ
jgi:hypothetical protein